MRHNILKFFVLIMGMMHLVNMQGKGQLPGPDFLIIGVQKSGTSALWRYLTKHPRIKWTSKALLQAKYRPYNQALQDYLKNELGQEVVLSWD